jgi:hypothetical protein
MTPEGKVKEKVKKLLKEHGAYWHMPVMNGMGAPALDFHCCHRGRFFAIETKAGSKLMTERQEHTSEEIRGAGGLAFLVNETAGLDELREWLTRK